MNEIDRHERLQKTLLIQSKAVIFFEVALYFIFFSMACFWWYGEPGKEVGKFGGGLAVVMLWVYTFNRLPSVGFNCIKRPRAIFFHIPVSVIGTAGFLIGIYNT